MPDTFRYHAITLGPIYKTLGKAEKTRELWGGSYVFSWICRELLTRIKAAGVSDDQILLPTAGAFAAGSKPGVGLFPDRILYRADSFQFSQLSLIVADLKTELANKIIQGIERYSGWDFYGRLFRREILLHAGGNVKSFLGEYFQIYTLEATESGLLQLLNEKGEPLGKVKSLNLLADHLELRASVAHFDPDPVKVFLRAVNHTFLLKDAFHNSVDHFDSLPEIATVGLRFVNNGAFRKEYDALVAEKLDHAIADERAATIAESNDEEMISEDEEDRFLILLTDQIVGIREHLRAYHGYVAIVHADGDNMGKLISTLQSDDDVRCFSADLFKFAQEANALIAGKKFTHGHTTDWGYGGSPIFIGGDDLVFFAPVATENEQGASKTIFHLVRELDQLFDSIFNKKNDAGAYLKYPNSTIRPCLTYGIQIAYVKHPLQESFVRSRELMDEIKHGGNKYKTRNRIHFRVRKHSGQTFGGVLDKNFDGLRRPEFGDLFGQWLRLLDAKKVPEEGKVTEAFVNSVVQALKRDEAVVIALVHARNNLKDYFDNNFNEPIHDRYRDYLNEIADLAQAMLQSYCAEILVSPETKSEEKPLPAEPAEVIELVHGLLRFVHFIRDKNLRHINNN